MKTIERLDARRYPQDDQDGETLLEHCRATFFREDSQTEVVICYVTEERSLVVLREGACVPPHYHKYLGDHDNGSELWVWDEASPAELYFCMASRAATKPEDVSWGAVDSRLPGSSTISAPGSVPHTVYAPEGGALWVWSPLSHMTGENSIPIDAPCCELDALMAKHASR